MGKSISEICRITTDEWLKSAVIRVNVAMVGLLCVLLCKAGKNLNILRKYFIPLKSIILLLIFDIS